MRILLLCHGFNGLSQRVFAELAAAGHQVSVEFDISDAVTVEAVELFRPDAVVAPFLKRRIPDELWRAVPCLIVHPGPPGDRGPAALDWAILERESAWGVSMIRATGELDGGPVMAWREFPTREARKSSLYRHEVTEAAVAAVFEALDRLAAGEGGQAPPAGRWRDPVPASARRIDWAGDDTATVLRKIRSADGAPGVVDQIGALEVRLFDARPEPELTGPPGELLARSGSAVCRATADGAVWIGHLRAGDKTAAGARPFKRAAVEVLGVVAETLPEAPAGPGRGPIAYREEGEEGEVGILEFDFYNGAMGVDACRALAEAFRRAASRPTRVIVLAGGEDFWSNGMDLNAIEAADSPADASWSNINAIDDLAVEILGATSHLVVSALSGAAAAGGVFLALAADFVWARDGVVLNPHYKNMGNLYGSEYWTYLLPRRVGEAGIEAVMGHRLPMLAKEAAGLGLIDATGPGGRDAFARFVSERARVLAREGFDEAVAGKRRRRAEDEAKKPLADYRAEELERMRLNFYGFDPSYHVARYRLVRRTPHAWTPLYLARHRRPEAPEVRRERAG